MEEMQMDVEKRILKNQMLIMDMLAFLVTSESNPSEMSICRNWDARQFVDSQIRESDAVIRGRT